MSFRRLRSAIRRQRRLVVVGMTLAAIGSGLGVATAAGTTALSATADAWVDSGNPTVNHGTTTYLQVDNSPDLHAYIRFDVPVPAGEHVTQALLTVRPNQSNSGGVEIRTSSVDWTESTITAANAPAVGTSVYATSGALTSGVDATMDVTGAVPAGGGAISLVVLNRTPTSFSIKSREASPGAPKLTVTTASDTTTPTAPTASFSTSPSSGAAPLTVQFTDTSTGAPTSWSWDFGDGATSTAQNPSHVYSTAGTYAVKLTASNAAGSDTATSSVTVTTPTAVAPTASFSTSPSSGAAPLTVQFTDTSTGTPTSWSWDFGDGATSTAQNPSHVYSTAGTYAVKLTASNAAGSDTATSSVTVTTPTAVAPTAGFTTSASSGAAPLTVQFTDTSTGTPTSWSWDFGDGATSTAQNPSHAYLTAGTYTATLTASNAQGTSTSSKSISVSSGSTNYGYRDQSFAGGPASPTGEKPESKAWFNDGLWWASMFNTASSTFHIYRLDRATESWVDTGTPLDDRSSTKADTLWDGTHLYVASHVIAASSGDAASGNPARLYRFSYDGASQSYQLDAGFPVNINNYSSETLVITRDSLGDIWATWAQASKVYAARSNPGGGTWGSPFTIPTSGASKLSTDDISAIVNVGASQVGVMWSNQNSGVLWFGLHSDSSSPQSGWTFKTVASGSKSVDDHISLKSLDRDTSGRLYAVVKTSYNDVSPPDPKAPLINLWVRDSSGNWSSHVVGRVADNHTRAIVVLDNTNRYVYVFATGPSTAGSGAFVGTIYMKRASMDTLSFPSGLGTPVIRDAKSAAMNNATSTKQTATTASGIVVLASNDSTNQYWHADLALTP